MRLHCVEAGVEAGGRAPVVLLHGLFGRLQNFTGLARRLSAQARVISMDLRNHGASPHAAGMEYATMAADVLETLAALGVARAALLGHSMGGKVAMAAALLAPAAVTRVLVADIAPVAYRHHNAAVAAALQGLALTTGLTRAAAARALEGAVPDAGVRAFLLQNLDFATPAWRIGLAEIARGMADIEAWPDFPAGVCYGGPALFIAGARSDYITPAAMAAARALFPTAGLATIPDAGHWLHADQPAAFAETAAAFLQANG